jgi:hypothetical protein
MRQRYLTEWAGLVTQAAHGGQLTGTPIQIARIQTIAGPRAGALEMHAGLHAGRLLKALSADDSAVLRQLVPWDFAGEPLAYMRGRYVRVEAGWPSDLAESVIRLTDVGQHPKEEGRWLAGKNEQGQIVTLGLNDNTPHFLLAGQTGSGKSVGMLAAAVQLGRDYDNQLMLLDGKYGVDLRQVAHLPTLAGPLVTDAETARSALAWAVADMRRRYEGRDATALGSTGVARDAARRRGVGATRLIILWDEPQEWLAADPPLVEMTRRLLAQGRGANVHLIMSTQHPVVSVFGDSASKRNLTGRLALKVSDFEASRVAVGGPTPRADHLLGAGDCYAVTPGAVHRLQGVYVDHHDFDALPAGKPLLEDWPAYRAENLGPSGPADFDGVEVGVSILAAHQGSGRPTLRQMLQETKGAMPGGDRARRLLALGRDAYGWLTSEGWGLCEAD